MKGYANNFLHLAKKVPKHYQFYAFADQDDVWLPSKLSTAISRLTECPSDTPALFCSNVELINADGIHIGVLNTKIKNPSFANALVQSIAGGHTMVVNSSLLKIFARIPQNSMLRSHDWMLYQLCTGFDGEVYYYPKPLVCYRQHSANLIGNNQTMRSLVKRVFFFFNGRLKSGLDDNAKILTRFVGEFGASNQRIFFQSHRIRQSKIFFRLLFWKSPMKRQSYLETWVVRIGILFGLV